jgi:hypothetical protein
MIREKRKGKTLLKRNLFLSTIPLRDFTKHCLSKQGQALLFYENQWKNYTFFRQNLPSR